jgi:hypothetical protein
MSAESTVCAAAGRAAMNPVNESTPASREARILDPPSQNADGGNASIWHLHRGSRGAAAAPASTRGGSRP